jgi:vacuolar-type H+-ATPase subunit H
MSGVIEESLKALSEFESALDRAKAEATETKRRMIKDATDWAESAKEKAIERAKAVASETLSKARSEAESQAQKIKLDGQRSLKGFETSLSKNMKEGTELVLKLLLGETE